MNFKLIKNDQFLFWEYNRDRREDAMGSQDFFKRAEVEEEQMRQAEHDIQNIQLRAQSEETAAKNRYKAHAEEHERLMYDAKVELKREQEQESRAAQEANKKHTIKKAIKRSIF